MVLKFVNDTTRSIYAFEMLPPPAIDAPNDAVDQQFNSEDCVANNTVAVVPNPRLSRPTFFILVTSLTTCCCARPRQIAISRRCPRATLSVSTKVATS